VQYILIYRLQMVRLCTAVAEGS